MKDSTTAVRSRTLEIAESWRRARPDLDLSHFLQAIYVMRLGRVLDDAYDRMCRARFSISGSDTRVLFALRRAGKPYARRPTDLFRALLVTSGAMTKQVDRLSSFGFVERVDDPARSGGFLILLTAKGLKAANAATEMLVDGSPITRALRSLSAPDRVALQRLVEHTLMEVESSGATEPTKGVRKGRKSETVAVVRR